MLGEMLNPFIKALHEELDGEKLEEGDEVVIVGADAVVIFSLEDDTLKVNVIAGKPKIIDAKINLIEGAGE